MGCEMGNLSHWIGYLGFGSRNSVDSTRWRVRFEMNLLQMIVHAVLSQGSFACMFRQLFSAGLPVLVLYAALS